MKLQNYIIKSIFQLFDIAGPVEGLVEDDVTDNGLENHSGL